MSEDSGFVTPESPILEEFTKFLFKLGDGTPAPRQHISANQMTSVLRIQQ